ncbi:MAG: hypothetical protein RIF46_15680 [Cyclobacteriaceae bacterium]
MKIAVTLLILFSFSGIRSQVKQDNPFFFKESDTEVKVGGIQLTTLGTYYYDNNWNAGNIYFNNGEVIRGYYMKYDLVRSYLEVIIDRDIVGFSKDQVKSFEWFSAKTLKSVKFINRKELGFETDIPHFLEIISDGDVMLLKSKNVVAVSKGSAPTLVNDTTDDTQVFEENYLVIDGIVESVVNGRRKNLKLFNSKPLEEFVRNQSLNFNNSEDLKTIIDYYNSIGQ